MSNEPSFRSESEEIVALREDLLQVRAILKELLHRLNQIERHASRAFGRKRSATASEKRTAQKRDAERNQTLSEMDAEVLFGELTSLWRAGENSSVQQRLAKQSIENLKFFSHYLGLSLGKTVSKAKLLPGIIGRISESVLLGVNRNVTRPTSDDQS